MTRRIRTSLFRAAFAMFAVMPIAAAPAFAASGDALHTTTFVKLPGDYAQKNGRSWETVARYVDYSDVDQRGSEAAHNAGIKVGFYTDVHLFCEGLDCSGSPDPKDVPEAAFAHSCDGARVYSHDDNPRFRKMLGDPRKPELSQTLNRVIAGKLHNRYGDFHEDFVFDDDVFIPDQNWFPWFAGSPRGRRLDQAYCGYSTPEYITGIKRVMADAQLPVIFNGMNSMRNLPYVQNASNVIGGMCEDCLHASYDKKRNREPSPFWNQEMDAALASGRNKKMWIAYPHGAIDNDTQGYIYASLLLGYNGRFLALDEDIATPSGIPLPPTILLVPHASHQPQPVSIEELKRAGGTYAREYSRCTIAGVDVGPCAAVVNPDRDHAKPYPFAQATYRHQIRIEGAGVMPEFGDTGFISPRGDAPPAWIGPQGWAIVFR